MRPLRIRHGTPRSDHLLSVVRPPNGIPENPSHETLETSNPNGFQLQQAQCCRWSKSEKLRFSRWFETCGWNKSVLHDEIIVLKATTIQLFNPTGVIPIWQKDSPDFIRLQVWAPVLRDKLGTHSEELGEKLEAKFKTHRPKLRDKRTEIERSGKHCSKNIRGQVGKKPETSTEKHTRTRFQALSLFLHLTNGCSLKLVKMCENHPDHVIFWKSKPMQSVQIAESFWLLASASRLKTVSMSPLSWDSLSSRANQPVHLQTSTALWGCRSLTFPHDFL